MAFNITMRRRVFLSVGDVSASNYLYEIFKDIPENLELVGITDSKLRSIGVESVGNISELSVVGIAEVVPKLFEIRRLYRKVLESLRGCDVLLACDAPGFNLRLIKDARKIGVEKIIYFISPQVWAWKPKRAQTIASFVDHLVVILPFEVEIYRKYESRDFRVHYVGHPLVDMVKANMDEVDFLTFINTEERPTVLMPGSRWGEIKRHTPYLRSILKTLTREISTSIVIPTFPEFKGFLEASFRELPVRILTPEDIQNPAYNSLAYSRFSLIASGTSSLEASLSLNPHAVFYRVSPITYAIGRLLVRVKYISLPNLILGKRVVEEFINRPPSEVVRHTLNTLSSEVKLNAMKEEFYRLRELLGGEGALRRLRALFLELIA